MVEVVETRKYWSAGRLVLLTSLEIFNTIMTTESRVSYIWVLGNKLLKKKLFKNYFLDISKTTIFFLIALRISYFLPFSRCLQHLRKNPCFQLSHLHCPTTLYSQSKNTTMGRTKCPRMPNQIRMLARATALSSRSMNFTQVLPTKLKMCKLMKGLIRLQMEYALISRSSFEEYHAK